MVSRAKDKLGDVLDVLGVREHVDGLYAAHLITVGEEADVASLRGRIAADVDDSTG